MARFRIRQRPRSLFSTNTFKLGATSLLTGLLPVLITCAYERRYPSAEEALAIAGLLSTFAFLLVGRVETSPVYTPDGLPGPNKSKFERGNE